MDENNKGKRAHAEHLRRNRLGELLEQLASVLPRHLVSKNSRQPDILNAAIKYVKECQNAELPAPVTKTDAKYVSKITNLKQYISELESRCDRYAKLLDNSGICKVPHIKETAEKSSILEQSTVNSEQLHNSVHLENVENSTNSISTGDPNSISTCGPIILLVQQRIGGGRRKRVQTSFPSAFKIQPLLPKPPSLNDIPVVNVSSSMTQENGDETLINSVQNENFEEQPIVVNIDAEEEDFVCTKLREDVAVGTDLSSVITCEMECQTDSFVTDGRSKFVDRGASPCIFDEQTVSNPRKYPKININNSDVKNNKPVPKKPRTDAISEIVNFIVDMPDKELSNIIGLPATVNGKNVQQRSRRSSNVVCAPSLLRVEDILQPVVGSTNMAGYSNPSSNAATTRTIPYSNKRSSTLTSKLPSKRSENIDKHSLAANNSSSSWREFLPNFSQIFPSYCPPAAPPPSKVHSDVVNSSSNKRNTFKTDSSVGTFHHVAADFSIESIQNGSEMNKIRSASQAQKNAAAKLSHFPCSSSNSSINAPNVSSSMPLPYSDMPMFLPCFPNPPNFNESKNKSKRSDAISLSSSVNNPLIPTDGSQEVNLSNSIFDMQGNNGVNCGSFVPPYHTGQPVNFYNFSSSKMPSSNITVVTSEDRSTDSQSIAWQWSDHGFSSQNYSQSLDSTQTSGQKGQNFHIAAMFPEATTPLTNSTTAHLSPSYRWNEPRLSNDHGGGSSMSSASAHHYSSHNEPSSWAPPQLRSYNNHDRTSNSFMPSFNFSQPNSHN